MKKKSNISDQQKLMDRITPMPTLGRLLGILATSYEMQPEFFETDFLPTVLGLGAWDDRNWTSRIALEKHLAELEAATVLIDARPYRGRPRSLRVEVEPVHLQAGRILHAKVLLLVYEDAVRFTFGSANLTEPGYRRNREVAAAVTATANRPTEARIVLDALHELRPLLSQWLTPGAVELCDVAEERLAEWLPDDKEQSEWFVWGGGSEPLWQQVIARWPSNDHIERVTIVSPFWSDEGENGPIKKFVGALKDQDLLSKDVELRLLTEAAPDKQGTYKPKLPESFATFDATAIGVSASAFAVDPRVPPEEAGMRDEFTGTRNLHAKVALLEGADTSLTFFGSANFSNRGWGFFRDPRRANIEAGLVLLRSGRMRRGLQNLIPGTIGSPVPLAGAAKGRLAPPEPSPEEQAWPAFIHEVLLAPLETDPNELGLIVVIDHSLIDGPWRMENLPNEDVSPGAALCSMETSEPIGSERITISLSTSQLERLLREQEVQVIWWLCETGRAFPINVVASAKASLPISPGTGHPAEQHLIAYYQGRINWEDLFPNPEEQGPHDTGVDESELSGVDTSKIQSYIVREFVEALQGISDDLKSAAQSPKACMRLALLGTVSPVALARRVLESAQSGERTPTAAGFQLVEILGCLDTARRFPASGRFKVDWDNLVDEAARRVSDMIGVLRQQFPGGLTNAFQRYEKTVQRHYRSGAGGK